MEFILVSLLLVVFTFADATVCVSDTEYESYMMTTLIKDIEERIKSFRQSIKGLFDSYIRNSFIWIYT